MYVSKFEDENKKNESIDLGELLKYMHLVKDTNSYVDQYKIKGLLFVDDIKLGKSKFRDLEIINRREIKLNRRIVSNLLFKGLKNTNNYETSYISEKYNWGL